MNKPVGLPPPEVDIEHDRTSLNRAALQRAFLDNLFYIQATFPRLATPNDYYMALAHAVRDRMLHR